MDDGSLGTDIKAVFYRVDSDRNGLIDIKELYNALKHANENHFNPETCQLLMGKIITFIRYDSEFVLKNCILLPLLATVQILT